MAKILLADQAKPFVDLELAFLRRTDHRVLTAKDGHEALRLVRDEQPDLVLLDIELPGLNGLELCRAIKASADLKETPVIFVTAHAKRKEYLSAGCDAYLEKPVQEATFLRAVKRFLSFRERREPRVPLSCLVSYNGWDGRKIAYTQDMSMDGMRLMTRESLPLGSYIPMELTLPMKGQPTTVKVIGKVTRHVTERHEDRMVMGTGVEFIRMTPRGRALLEAVIESVMAQPGISVALNDSVERGSA